MSLLPPGPPGPPVLRLFGDIVDWTVVAIGATIIALVFVNVLFHLANLDIAWTTELSEVLMVWVTFLGGAAAARRAEHVGITELVDKLSDGARPWADGIAQVTSAFVLGLLMWYGMYIVDAGWTSRLTVLDWPMSIEYLALPVASASTLVFVLFDLVQIVQGRSRVQRYGDA